MQAARLDAAPIDFIDIARIPDGFWDGVQADSCPASVQAVVLSPALDLAVAHLNAPYGEVVAPEDLAAVLVRGSLDAVAGKPPVVAAVLCGLFVELSPALIGRCMREAGGTFESVQALYDELAPQTGRVPAWELAVAHFG